LTRFHVVLKKRLRSEHGASADGSVKEAHDEKPLPTWSEPGGYTEEDVSCYAQDHDFFSAVLVAEASHPRRHNREAEHEAAREDPYACDGCTQADRVVGEEAHRKPHRDTLNQLYCGKSKDCTVIDLKQSLISSNLTTRCAARIKTCA